MINKLLLLIFLSLSIFSIFIEIDNSLEVWIEDSPDKEKWLEFCKDFHSSDFVVLGVQNNSSALSANFVAMLTKIEAHLKTIKYVEGVVSIATVFNGMMDFDEDGFGDDLDDLKIEIDNSFYRNLLVGKNGYYGIFIYFTPMPKKNTHEFVNSIKKATQNFSNYHFRLAGPIVLNTTLDTMSQKDSHKLFPLAVILFFILLWLRIRSFGLAFIVLLVHSLSITALLGVMAIWGSKLNMLSVTIAPLLLILGGAPSIHFLHRWKHHMHYNKLNFAIQKSISEISYPCICSLLTTAIAFLSFMVSSMQVIYNFGLWMAIGLLFALLVNLYILPFFISMYARIYKLQPEKVLAIKNSSTLSVTKAWMCVCILSIATIVALIFAFSPRRAANILLFLPEEHTLRIDYQVIGTNLTGLFSLELLVEAKNANAIPWHWLEQMTLELEKNKGVAKVYGPTTLLRNIFRASLDKDISAIPENANIDMAIISMEGIIQAEWQRMVKDYGKKMRFSILTNNLNSQEYLELVDQIENITAPSEISLIPTGIITLVEKAQHNLVKIQLESFALAAGIICLLLIFIVPNKRLALLMIPVNLIPPLITFSLMILFDVELNVATIMITSIAIGIAIDDSLHISHFFLQEQEGNISQRLLATLENVKQPVITSSIANAGGFLVLCFAGFVPLQYFGLFTAIGIFVALLCDLFLLPALILLFGESI